MKQGVLNSALLKKGSSFFFSHKKNSPVLIVEKRGSKLAS